MKNSMKIKRLVGMATLTSLVIVLQLLGNFIPNFANSLALALIPIAVGAILYGPLAGFFLGAVMSATVATNPTNYSLMQTGTDTFKLLIVMFIKSPLAGLAAGYAYKAVAYFAKKADGKKRNVLFFVAVFTASVVVPIVNTLTYAVGMLLLFEVMGSESFKISSHLANNPAATGGTSYGSAVAVVFLFWISFNFFIEFGISAIATQAIVMLLKVLSRNYNLGFYNDFSKFNGLEDEDDEPELNGSEAIEM